MMDRMKENDPQRGPRVVLKGKPTAKKVPTSPPMITVRQQKQQVKVSEGGLKKPMSYIQSPRMSVMPLEADVTNRPRRGQHDEYCGFNESPVPDEMTDYHSERPTTIFF